MLNLFMFFFNDILPDIDECATGADMCDTNATCTNTVGSYNCTCNNGLMGNGFICGKYSNTTVSSTDKPTYSRGSSLHTREVFFSSFFVFIQIKQANS